MMPMARRVTNELLRGRTNTRWASIKNWKMNYDARVWVRPQTTTRVELVRGYTGGNGHNRHFDRSSFFSSVCRRVCTRKIELFVSCSAYFRGGLRRLQRMAVKPAGFACTGAISRVIVKVTSSSDLEKIRVRSKSTRGQAGRFQRQGLIRMLNKKLWEC